MRLRKIKLEQYKSIQSEEIEVSDINILIGKNNSGKSNFIDALLDYQTVMQKGPRHNPWADRRIMKKGGYSDFTIEIGIELYNDERKTLIDELLDKTGLDGSTAETLIENNSFRYFRHRINHGEGREARYELSGLLFQEMREIYRHGHQIQDRHIEFGHLPNNSFSIGGGGSIRSVFRDQLNAFVENWNYLDPFRSVKHTQNVRLSERLDSSGANLVQVLDSIYRNHPDKYGRIADVYKNIMEGVDDIRTILLDNQNTTTYIVEQGFDDGFNLNEISSGSKQILVLITKIVLAENDADVLLLEEPELHLHPAAEQRIYDLITEIVQGDGGPQIFMTTHSDIFVNQTDTDNILSVMREEGETIIRKVEGYEIDEHLAAIGYDKSGLYQSDTVLFVEGRSDKVILERLSERLGMSFDRHGVETVVLEGDAWKSDLPPILDILSQLQIPYTIILDSDDDDPDQKEESVRSKLGIRPEGIHVLEKRTIESYLVESPTAIAHSIDEDVAETEGFLADRSSSTNQKGVLDDLFKEFVGTGYHPEKNGVMIAKHMDEDEINEELRELIRDIVELSE